MTVSRLQQLLKHLISLPNETEWVEFKCNNKNPDRIGKYISAVANSAALNAQPFGYILWGIEDSSHTVVGTNFDPHSFKKGAELLQPWLARLLDPSIVFVFHILPQQNDKTVVILEVCAARNVAVRFEGVAYFRIGSALKNLKDYREYEEALWKILAGFKFENEPAIRSVSSDSILELLDYPSFFELTKQRLPDNRKGILEKLSAERLIRHDVGNLWHILNLGAILFAKNLNQFEHLGRKSVRLIIYDGKGRTNTLREQQGVKGYATGFAGLIEFIRAQLPHNEHIGEAFRTEHPLYPEITIRELIPNALIHQDFLLSGVGPMVEIFSDRIEITNPGKPLIEPDRFLDSPPQSRNDALASLMRRVHICEERGSGIDKVIEAVELYQLPPPSFEVIGNNTRVILFAPRNLTDMNKDERARACYQHACLRWASGQQLMTNASLRKRFAIIDKNYPQASRIITEAIDAGLIIPSDPENTSKKQSSYKPYWA